MGDTSKITLEVNGYQGGNSVEFEQVGDTYSHTIWLQKGQERIAVFKSVENSALLNLPCFTQLHQQGKNIFLTGANGPCHWSMSVAIGECLTNLDASFPEGDLFSFDHRYGLNAPDSFNDEPKTEFISFDVACRLKEPVSNLGSEYVKAEGFSYVGLSTKSLDAVKPVDGMSNMGMMFGANRLKANNDTTCHPTCRVTRDPSSNLRFYALEMSIEQYPATIQWNYGFWVV